MKKDLDSINVEENLHNFIKELEAAEKGTREEIFNKYGNELKPIAYIPKEYLQYFRGKVIDNKIYSGLGYFIDHAINHHPEVEKSKYRDIQDILLNPDEVIIDKRPDYRTNKERDNLIFVKRYDKNSLFVIRLENNKDRQILLHKSLYHDDKKIPYPSLPRIRDDVSGGGVSPIGRT